ncbi:MAG: ABC transporter ATP-binding protein [Pseudomonadota bacterium]
MFKVFERIIKPFSAQEPQQPPRGIIAFCQHFSKGMEIPLITLSLVTGLLAYLEVQLFGYMGQFVDWLTTKTPEELYKDEMWTLVFMAAVLIVILPLLSLLHALIVHQTLLGNYPMRIRWLAHRYLLGQSIEFYQNDFAGRLATKVMQTALSVRETVMKLLDIMVYIMVYFISTIFLISASDYRLALVLVIWLGVYIAIQWYFVPKLKKVSTEQADARSLMTGRIVDSYSNITTVKLFAHTAQETVYAKESMETFLGTVYRQMRYVTKINFSVDTANYVLVFCVAVVSLWLWQTDEVNAGAIAVALSLSLRLNGMAHWIMWEVSALFENIGVVADGMSTLSLPRQVQDKKNAQPIVVDQGKIEFDRIVFNYGKDGSLFHQLSLTIKSGEKIGIVGRSGAGKSTLINLLLRFYDLDGGEIRVDGQNIANVQQESLRSKVGMVTQDTALLHRSIRDNIQYGKPDASEAMLVEAVEKAEALHFINGLEDSEGNKGFDAKVGERGVKLSGGQRQRIAIARVLLKNAPILILDEATSALDSEVEAAIQQNLNQLMENKTVIAIAHRLSTIAAMDRLIVLEQGKIVEEGNHDALIEQGGIYAQLWKHQSGGFLGEE